MAKRLRFKVKEIARAKGISQEKIIRDSGLGRTTVSQIWRNKTRNPGVLVMAKIAGVLKVNPEDLQEWVDEDFVEPSDEEDE